MFMKQEQENTVISDRQTYITQMDQLKQTVEEEIAKLNKRKYLIDEPTSNADLLINRYQSEKSFIGGIALAYGGFALWKKIIIGLLVSAIGIGLGFLCHAPIAISVVCVVIYLIFTLLCIDHYNVNQKQMKLLTEDIIELEKSVCETIKLFNTFSEKLHVIYLKGYELSLHFADDVEQMDKKIEEFNIQLFEYKKTFELLSQSERCIAESSLHLVQSIERCSGEFDESCVIFTHKSAELSRINAGMIQINRNLKKAAETLSETQLCESYVRELKRIEEIAEKMQIIYDAIKSNPYLLDLVHSQALPNHLETLSHDRSPELEEADRLIEQAESMLNILNSQSDAFESLREEVAHAIFRSDRVLSSSSLEVVSSSSNLA